MRDFNNFSNKDIDWAKHYNFYEVELRDMYRTVSKPQNDSHFEMLKSKAKSFLKHDKVFCEIGFSAGITLRHALKYFGKVYGLDIAPENVRFTEKELKEEGFENVELYTSDLLNFDERFEDRFDVISFIHGLEHFTETDYPVLFSNIKKYLKKGGIFTGALPNNNRFNYRMCPHCNQVFEIDGHVSSHNLTSLKKLFTDNNFHIIHLDNFNLKYALSYGNIFKKAFRFIFYYILKIPARTQLEYIVQKC